MLAKPEYSSPPNEVCCWPGRRSGAAGRGAVAELLAGSNAAECHREDVAGLGAAAKLQTSLGAAAESHREDIAGRGAAAELLTGRYAVAKMLLAGGAVAKLLAGAPWRRGRQGTPQWQRGCWRGALRQSRRRRRGIPVARERHSRLARECRGRLAGNATADWHRNARNAKEPAPTDGTGPSQTFGCIQAEQSLVEDFVSLFLLGMRIYI